MFPDEVFKQRDELCLRIAELPQNYLKDNAKALMDITYELKKSFKLEFKIIQQVKRLDLNSKVEVKEFTWSFTDYVNQRGFELERTHCRKIANSYYNQIIPKEAGTVSDRDRVPELKSLLEQFSNADTAYLDEILVVMNKALQAIKKINTCIQKNQIEEAQKLQNSFVTEYEEEIVKLKEIIDKMNKTGDLLIKQL